MSCQYNTKNWPFRVPGLTLVTNNTQEFHRVSGLKLEALPSW